MIRYFATATLCATAVLAPHFGLAQAPASPEVLDEEMVASVLEQLQEITEEVKEGTASNRRTALERYQAAAGSEKSVVDFYMACVKELNFARTEASTSEFRDWTDRNEGRLKEKEVAAALRTQLAYLILSIKAAQAEEIGDVIPDLRSFLAGTVAAIPDFVGDDEPGSGRARGGSGGMNPLGLLRSSVKGTVFARAYGLDQSLEVEGWEFSPLNIAGIYQNTIIPWAFESSPEDVAELWDERIKYESFIAEHTLGLADYQIHLERTVPTLRWSQALDTFGAGQHVSGTKSMLAVINAHSSHPDCAAWIEELRSTVIDGYQSADTPAEDGDANAEEEPAAL